jgi:lysozyme family protein
MHGNFEACLAQFWDWDGAKNDEAEGEDFITSYGVTAMTWKAAKNAGIVSCDIENATKEDCANILRRMYWDKISGDGLPVGIDLMVFNDATLCGVRAAGLLLQNCCNMPDNELDGVIGPVTISYCKRYDTGTVMGFLKTANLDYLSGLKNSDLYLRGWTRRENAMFAAANAMHIATLRTV